jgi:hypothetical protein
MNIIKQSAKEEELRAYDMLFINAVSRDDLAQTK